MAKTEVETELAGLLTVNDKGQTSLQRLKLKNRYAQYTVEEMPGGTLVLVPVVLVPAGTVTTAELAAIRGMRAEAADGETA
jgi:hypothetical protein